LYGQEILHFDSSGFRCLDGGQFFGARIVGDSIVVIIVELLATFLNRNTA